MGRRSQYAVDQKEKRFLEKRKGNPPPPTPPPDPAIKGLLRPGEKEEAFSEDCPYVQGYQMTNSVRLPKDGCDRCGRPYTSHKRERKGTSEIVTSAFEEALERRMNRVW